MSDEDQREIEMNLKARQRIAFRKALADLPEIAPPEVRALLASVHMRDEFWQEGKRLQRLHGLEAVAPRVEQECAAGAWSFMRQGILAAIAKAEPTAPASSTPSPLLAAPYPDEQQLPYSGPKPDL